MDEYIKKFLEEDEIDMVKLFANSEIMENETKEIYQARARLYNQEDISDKATKTIHWIAKTYNQPLGYPVWFMTAYPDVVRWVSELAERRTIDGVLPILGELSEKDIVDNKISISFLRKMVDIYKQKNSLECC